MSYEPKPNEATLWENKFKTTDAHPTKKGQLLITRQLLLDLCEQQGKGGDFLVDVSAWERLTAAGKQIINIKIEKPYKFGEQPPAPSDRLNPDYTPTRTALSESNYASEPEPKQPPTKTPPTPEKYLAALKGKIAAIENYPDFETLSNKINSPEVWAVFATNAAIAQEAKTLLKVKKGALILATAPIDLSAIISKIDVEIARLKLPAKQHCLARWDKSRMMLTPEELQIYLDELAIAEPVPPSNDFF